MLKYIYLIALFIAVFSQAQEKKYQSLLWEISGNGLQKKSYLYGSMHVSEKVSYHLSDAFFKHLLEADFVANESDPEKWSDLYAVFGNMYPNNYINEAFYSNFYLSKIKKQDLYPLFLGTNYNLIGLLSRTNEMKKDFQEDTYLDMFIYRTGKKYGKKTIGLEDIKTSTINILKAEATINYKEVDENRQTLLKLLKNKNYNESLMNYYREKDLDMLDTLTTLASSASYLKAMLYDRNIVMAKSMDSIMKKGSLFAAVGAAHLPGKKGIIEILRKKGYTVLPIFDNYTEIGKKTKKEIETYFTKPSFSIKTTSDGMISIPLNKIVIENGENLESPDLANGGYINVKRLPLIDFLDEKNMPFNHKTLDSLFYENIPGEILEKKTYNQNNYVVYDIKNKTKTNNAQHYRYYITPLEIIAVIMGGEGEYVRKFESEVFNTISIKNNANGFIKFQPKKGGFEVDIPTYYIAKGNKDIDKSYEDITLLAHDEQEKSHYFLIEKSLNDTENLENTSFELQRIHYEFYNQHDIDSTNTSLNIEKNTFLSNSKLGEKNIRLKSVIKGNKYYLLGTIGASDIRTNKYFESFSLKNYDFTVKNKKFTDSLALFSVEIPEKQNEYLDFKIEPKNNNYQKKENIFETKSKNFLFKSPTGNEVNVSFYQYHKYESEKNIDSVWNNLKKILVQDFTNNTNLEEFNDIDNQVNDAAAEKNDFNHLKPVNKTIEKGKVKLPYDFSRWNEQLNINNNDANKIVLLDEKILSNKNASIHQMDVMATKPKSNQAIKYKAIFKDRTTYLLKTLVEKNYVQDNYFIENTFNTFKPFDTLLKPTVFENKMQYFIEDAQSKNDTIRYAALQSIYFLNIEKKDLPQLKKFLDNFEFKKEENQSLVNLYEKIGQIKDPSILPFLENSYKNKKSTAALQFAILNALINQKSKTAYSLILKLLEHDLPVSEDEYEVQNLFTNFEKDIENSAVLFPDIFQFYSIKEYHKPIIDFTSKLVSTNLGNPKKLKNYKKMLVTNAKLEYKRVLSWQQNKNIEPTEAFGFYDDEKYAPTQDLSHYLNILYPFKKDKNISILFDKVALLNLDNIAICLASIQMDRNGFLDKKTIAKLASKAQTKFSVTQMLHHTKQLDELYLFKDDSIAMAAIIYFDELKKDKQELNFIEKKIITKNKKNIQFYFYKTKDIAEESHTKNIEKITGIGFVMENGKINPQAFYKLNPKTIIDEKQVKTYIKTMIDESTSDNHLRATYQKADESENFNYQTEYFGE